MTTSELEAELANQLFFAGAEEPVREHHPYWCCEHRKSAHFEAVCAACVAARPPLEYRHEYRHERDWRSDFAWPTHKLAVEVEGGVWTHGRHTRGAGFTADAAKYNRLAADGWTVLRFTRATIKDGEALHLIMRQLALCRDRQHDTAT